MNYIVKCNNCYTENELYRFNCKKCGSVLHNKIANLEIWKTIQDLLDSPTRAYKNIIYSEQKNFVLFFLILGFIKLIILKRLVYNLFQIQIIDESIISNFLMIIPLVVFIISMKIFALVKKIRIRFRDLISLFSYSLSVVVLISIILFPAEYAILGNAWLTFNPSPFILKPSIAILFLSIEGILILILCFYFYILFKIFFTNKINCILLSITIVISQILI